MGEGGDAHVRLVRGGGEVDDLGDRVRDPRHLAQGAFGEHLLAVLQLQGRHHGEQVRVADPLAVAVGRALHVGRARVHRGQGVRDRAARVVLGVDAEPGAGVREDRGDDRLDLGREHAAVRVAEHHHVGARLRGRADHGLRVLRVRAVAVEEVLAVDEDPAAVGPEVGHRVADHLQVLFEGGPQGEFHMAVVGLRHQRDHRGAGLQQPLDLRVLARLGSRAAGGAERHQLGVLEVDLLLGAGEELGVARVGAGPAALDEAHPEVVQVPCDGQLVRHGEVDALTLRAVAQGRVEDVERIVELAGFGHGVRLLMSDLGLYRNDRLHRPPILPRALFPA